MSNILRNRVKSSNESRRKYSSNFIMDQLLKQKLYEIENIINIRNKAGRKEINNNVNILKLEKLLI